MPSNPAREPDRPHDAEERDQRQFVKVAVDIVANDKVAAAMDVDPMAGWAHVAALCYCRLGRTNGHFPLAVVAAQARLSPEGVKAMVAEGLWHETGHDCPRCPQPRRGNGYAHDCLRHQPSAEKTRSVSATRRQVGAKGLATRWGATPEEREKRKAERAAARKAAKAWDQPAEPAAAEESAAPTATKKVASRAERGTRIPDDFAITPEMAEWGRARVPYVNGPLETEKFINYWQAKAGKDATRLDWVKTWKNWMLNAKDRYPGPAAERSIPERRSTASSRAQQGLDAAARLDAKYGVDGSGGGIRYTQAAGF